MDIDTALDKLESEVWGRIDARARSRASASAGRALERMRRAEEAMRGSTADDMRRRLADTTPQDLLAEYVDLQWHERPTEVLPQAFGPDDLAATS